MTKNYFNAWETKQAIKLIETNPLKASEIYEEYLEKYPKDYTTYTFYANDLIVLGEFEKARKILEYVKILYKKDSRFCNDYDKRIFFERKIIWDTLRLLSYEEKYDELYDFYLENFDIIKDMGVNNVDIYFRKKAGHLDIKRNQTTSYTVKQIIEYREEDFKEHIKKHLSNCDDITQKSTGVFNEDFPIDEVIEEIKKYIPNDKKLCYGFIENNYIFKYDECGRDNNKLVNYFKVVCLHNTNNFITMYPSVDCENLPYIDLNYMIKNKDDIKVKRLSQIEKFNNKYNKK